jgi:uncharacterized protein (TIGR03437 family)
VHQRVWHFSGKRALVVGHLSGAGLLPTEVDGASVLIDGVAAPSLHLSVEQVNAVLPFFLLRR